MTPSGFTVKDAPNVRNPVGQTIIESLKNAGIRFVVALPDIVTSEGLLWPISRDKQLRLIRICREEEGVSICAAMSYNDTRAILLMQQTGLMASLNALRAVGMEYRLPVAMMVGLQGKEVHLSPEKSNSYGVRIIRPVLDAMGIPHTLIEQPDDVSQIVPAIDDVYSRSLPHALLVGRALNAA